MLLAAAVLGMGGCGKTNQPASADNGGTGVRTVETSIELSVFTGSMVENTPIGIGLKVMIDYVNEDGGGTLKVTNYYNTASGDVTSVVQGFQQGAIDIGVPDIVYFSGLVPEVEVFQLSLLFDNLEEARVAVNGVTSEKIFEKFAEEGIVGLVFWENGFRELGNSTRPVAIPADLSSIRMRILPAIVQMEIQKALGALPAAIDASESYTALQQGTTGAEENPLHETVLRKFYKVQQYITLTGHVYTPFTMGTSQKTWDKLSDQQKLVVMNVANASKEAQRKASEEKTIETKQVLLDNGCEIVENPDKEAFKETAASAWKVFIGENGTELLDIIQGD